MSRYSTDEKASFLHHAPCPDCGSSDALSVYSDGHTYCFACQKHTHGDDAPRRGRTHMASGLIPAGSNKPIAKRRLSAETLAKFGYSIGTHKGKTVHIAPFYDRDGNLVAQHIRTPEKEFYWLGNAKGVTLFGQGLWRNDGGKMLVITEGELDAMSVSQAQGNKFPVVSIPGGASGAKRAIAENLDWIETYAKVVFAFDNDAPGRAAAQECALILTPGKARIATFPEKDASDMLVAGRIKEMIDCLWSAAVYRPDGIISGGELWGELLKKPKEGYESPYPLMNAMLRGIRKGELYLFTAGSGIGKSTLVNEIGYHFMMEHTLSLGVIALEESKKRTAERYVGIHLNRPIHYDREGLTEDELKKAFDTVLNNDRFWLYDHFGSMCMDNLLAKLRYMVVSLGVDFIILDHISIVVSGLDEVDESERKTIDKLMTRIRSLVEETGVGILAIVHLKRPDKGAAYNEGRQVSLTDLRGSASLEQLSDAVIALERNQQDEDASNVARIRVLKNRPVGTVGLCDTITYDQETGRLEAPAVFDDFSFQQTPPPTQPATVPEERDF